MSRKSVLACLLSVAMAGSSSSVAAGPPARPATHAPMTVAIRGFAFSPQVLTVAAGTTVTWTNADEDPHTVVATGKAFHSAALDTDDQYSFTFTKAGDYAYFCSLHPHMTGKIIVKAS